MPIALSSAAAPAAGASSGALSELNKAAFAGAPGITVAPGAALGTAPGGVPDAAPGATP
jgi:hypothetical protein